MTPFWLFQAPEIRKSLFGVFRGLKWPYVGVFRGLKRHLIGWKRWYYGSILKWLTNTEKTVPTQSGSVQVLPQHIFFCGGGSGTATIVQGAIVQGDNCPRDFCPRDSCPRRLLSKEDFCPRSQILIFLSKELLLQKWRKKSENCWEQKNIIEIFFKYSWNVGSVLLMDFCTPPPPPGWFGAKLFSIKQDEQPNYRARRNGVLGAQ